MHVAAGSVQHSFLHLVGKIVRLQLWLRSALVNCCYQGLLPSQLFGSPSHCAPKRQLWQRSRLESLKAEDNQQHENKVTHDQSNKSMELQMHTATDAASGEHKCFSVKFQGRTDVS